MEGCRRRYTLSERGQSQKEIRESVCHLLLPVHPSLVVASAMAGPPGFFFEPPQTAAILFCGLAYSVFHSPIGTFRLTECYGQDQCDSRS